jgi:hypothetical protein
VTSSDELRERVAKLIFEAWHGEPYETAAAEVKAEYAAPADAVAAWFAHELERRDADAAKAARWQDTYHRLLLQIEAHIGKAFDPEWLEAEDRGLVDAVELLVQQRDTLVWLHAEAVWRLRGMARRVGEWRGTSAKHYAEFHQAVEDWGRNDEAMLAENQRLADELALAQERIAKTRQALRLDEKWSVQHGALAVRSERDRAVAERDALRAQLAAAVKLPSDTDEAVLIAEVQARFGGTIRAVVGHGYRNGYNACECGLSTPTLGDWKRHTEELRAVGAELAHLPAPVSESVPATPNADQLSMVAHPELDFPDCLTEFHRGAVFAYRQAMEKCEDWGQDVARAYAAQYRHVARWLEARVERYREQAAKLQDPPSVDLPEVEAASALPSFVTTTGPCCGHAFDRHNKLSGCLDCACTVMQKDHHHAPPSAGEADTTPRVWKAGDAEPPAWVVALAQPPGSYWKYLIRGTKSGWYFSNSLTPEAPIVEGSGWGWAISRAELPLTQVTEVRDCHGDVWTWVPSTFEWSSPETQNCAWSYMAKKWRPLVEVLPNTEQEARQ